MKSLTKKFMALGLAAAMLTSMTACGSSSSATSTAAAGTAASGSSASAESTGELQKIGFLSAAWSDDYCKRLNDALVELGSEYGFEVNALNGAPDGNPDVSKYMEGIDSLLAGNPEAMIVQPLFTLPDYCMKFNGQIPLTFINISPEISETSKDLEYWYAGCFDTNIGAQLAEEMSAGLKEGAKICMLNLTYGQTNTAQREEGFKTWMAENRPDVEILETNYVEKIDPTNAQTIFEDWIQKYGVGGFDGVATQGSMLSQGVVESMKKYGLDTSNFTLAGISASTTEWVRDGLEFVELYQDPYAEARAALEATRAQLDGTTGELTPLEGTDNVLAVPMTPINKDNVDQFDF
ncbi:MAG: substrate-binding domain-containing protein [Eubacteriales bacterium]|nr:substrate-binding domain-containing protein [Eubacteriales bacterium]